MQQTRRRTVGAMMLGGVAALAMTLTSVVPALAAPGDDTMTCRSTTVRRAAPTTRTSRLSTRETHARRHRRSTSTSPRAPARRNRAHRRRQPRPGLRPTPGRRVRAVRRRTTPSDFTLTQAQIDYLGDELANQIVARRRGALRPDGAADPGDPASDSLVMLVYNVAGRRATTTAPRRPTRPATSRPTSSTRPA